MKRHYFAKLDLMSSKKISRLTFEMSKKLTTTQN